MNAWPTGRTLTLVVVPLTLLGMPVWTFMGPAMLYCAISDPHPGRHDHALAWFRGRGQSLHRLLPGGHLSAGAHPLDQPGRGRARLVDRGRPARVVLQGSHLRLSVLSRGVCLRTALRVKHRVV